MWACTRDVLTTKTYSMYLAFWSWFPFPEYSISGFRFVNSSYISYSGLTSIQHQCRNISDKDSPLFKLCTIFLIVEYSNVPCVKGQGRVVELIERFCLTADNGHLLGAVLQPGEGDDV